MILDCDFERHGLVKIHENDISNFKIKQFALLPERPNGHLKMSIFIRTIRKKMQEVELFIDGQLLVKEVMWSPEQLRMFLISHGIIVVKKLPIV